MFVLIVFSIWFFLSFSSLYRNYNQKHLTQETTTTTTSHSLLLEEELTRSREELSQRLHDVKLQEERLNVQQQQLQQLHQENESLKLQQRQQQQEQLLKTASTLVEKEVKSCPTPTPAIQAPVPPPCITEPSLPLNDIFIPSEEQCRE